MSTMCRRRSTKRVALIKLASLGVSIDSLTAEQADYLNSWAL